MSSNQATERIEELHHDNSANVGMTTANPRAPKGDPTVEKPGFLASDSLAAESLSSGGAFASNNDGTTSASSVAGNSSTANTSDTSGATVLPPTKAGADRKAGFEDVQSYGSANDGSSVPSSGNSTGNDGPAYGTLRAGSSLMGNNETVASSTNAADVEDGSSGSGNRSVTAASSSGGGSSGSDENANPKPHGMNITEGGFDSDAPNASFNNEIGSKNDPGRLAEQQFAHDNATSGADAGYGGTKASQETGGQLGGFEKLSSSEDA